MLARTITVLSALALTGALWGLHMPSAESRATSALTTIKCAGLGFSITIPAGWGVTGRCTDDMSATGMYAQNYGVGISIMTSTDWKLSPQNTQDTIDSGCNVGTRESVKRPRISTSTEGGITRATATCMTKDAQGDRFHVGMVLTQVQTKTYAVFMSIGVAPSEAVDAMLTKLVVTTLARFIPLGHGTVPTVVPFATAPKLIPSAPTATAAITGGESTTSSGTARIICTSLGFSIDLPVHWTTAGRCSDEMTASGSYEGRYYGTAIVSVEPNSTLAAEAADAFIYRACDVGTSENITPPQVSTTSTGEPTTTALCTTKSASGTTFHTGILVTAAGGRVYTLTVVISTATDATTDASLQQLLLTTLRHFALLSGEEAATPTVTATATEPAATATPTQPAATAIPTEPAATATPTEAVAAPTSDEAGSHGK